MDATTSVMSWPLLSRTTKVSAWPPKRMANVIRRPMRSEIRPQMGAKLPSPALPPVPEPPPELPVAPDEVLVEAAGYFIEHGVAAL